MAEHSNVGRPERWTSDHLLAEGGTQIYSEMQRRRLRPEADAVQALLHEYRAHLETRHIEGDRPLQGRIRAWRVSRPMARLQKHLRKAVNEAKNIDTEYQRAYVELPKRREERRRQRQLKANPQLPASGSTGNADIHSLPRSGNRQAATGSPQPSGENEAPTFMDFLNRGSA